MLDESFLSSSLESARIYTDQNALSQLKSKNNSPEAIKAVAKEFESLYINMMFKSMRQANQAFSEGNFLQSREQEFFREMLDSQYSMELAQKGGIGIADILIQQLSPNHGGKQKSHTDQTLSMAPVDFKEPMVLQEPMVLEVPVSKVRLNHQEMVHSNNSAQTQADEAAFRNAQTQAIYGDAQSLTWTDQLEETAHFKPMSAKAMKAYQNTEKSTAVFEVTDFNAPESFIENMLPYATKAAKTLKVDPLLLVAQAALETGWGKHIMDNGQGGSSYNLFGIKASKNIPFVEQETLEYEGATPRHTRDRFRVYQNFQQSFDDYVALITTASRYSQARSQTHKPEAYMRSLQQSGYATDPQYANKVMAVYRGIGKKMAAMTQPNAVGQDKLATGRQVPMDSALVLGQKKTLDLASF